MDQLGSADFGGQRIFPVGRGNVVSADFRRAIENTCAIECISI